MLYRYCSVSTLFIGLGFLVGCATVDKPASRPHVHKMVVQECGHHHHHNSACRGYYKRNYRVLSYNEAMYPSHYYGLRHAADVRISQQDIYGQGFDAGCRTASTGTRYKNPKLISSSYAYQIGWEAGFDQCHYDRTHINDVQQSKYSYIPY